MNRHTISLNQELPFPGRGRWGYQHFPVFSTRWWRGRLLVFGLGALTLTLMTGMGMWMDFSDSAAALTTTLKFGLGILGMTRIGPSAMTLARMYIAPGFAQASWVSAGMIVGLVGAVLMDSWSSKAIEEAFVQYSASQQAMASLVEKQQESPNMALTLFNALVVFVIYFWCAGGIAFVRYWREPGLMQQWVTQQELSKARASQHDAEARLSILQAQIEPHFLFNTLASLKSVLHTEPQRAEAAIDDLVDYLRASVPRLNHDQQLEPITIGQQVKLCEAYLKLMQLRMGSRLTFNINVSENLDDRAFPPLVLISLVENAIKHGLEPKPSGGHLAIDISSSANHISISVTDNGLGLGKDQPLNSTGVGLNNIRNQLQLLYPKRATLDLRQNDSGGVTATIHITDFINSQTEHTP